ncbi:hypothetical protein M0802_011864 [Mischocyttarus mexicanus]|nr:hypothetical protein M0802_011864 [Mischocyttarus mexicanus]
MTTKIFGLFFLTFTIIHAIFPPCLDNSGCHCMAIKPNQEKIFCQAKNITKYIIDIKTGDYLQIICNDWNEWEDFKFASKLAGRIINLLEFEYCGLSNNISLKEVAKQLGVERTKTLIFKSFKNFNGTLRKMHFEGFGKVKNLVLTNNSIINMSSDVFLNFPDLEWLDLSHNNVKLPVDIFYATPNLKRLTLSYNDFRTINPGLFSNLDNLEFLNLSENKIKTFEDKTFDELVSLKDLNLASNILHNVSEKTFSKLKNLELIDISYNNLSNVQPNLFKENKELRHLLFHSNRNALSKLPVNLLSNLRKLEKVDLHSNEIIVIEESFFWDLSLLRHIDLSENSIETLPKDIFKGLRNVKELIITDNLIKTLPDGIFKDMENLGTLDLSFNLMDFITKDLFEGLSSLTELNMEINHLTHIEETALKHMVSLKVAKFSHNQLEFSNTSAQSTLFHSNLFLKELYLSFNKIQSFFSDWSTNGYNLQYLDLSDNNISTLSLKIKELDPTTYICPEDEYFEIENNCQINCTCSVRPNDKTRILDCSNKKMSKFVIDVERMTFVDNYSLILNLTGNLLTEIPSLEPLKPLKLTSLLLSNNHISQITSNILPENLTILELHNNNMSKIDSDVLDYVKTKSLKEFTFSGNPLKCDCNTKDFLDFVKLKLSDYKDLENVKCQNMDFYLHKMFNEELVCPFDYTIIIIITVSVLILCIAGFLIWYNRIRILAMLGFYLPINIVRFTQRRF